jgi:hypothetical protein
MFLFLGKVDPRVIIEELDHAVDLGLAAVLLDGKNEIIDPFEQLPVLAVDRRDAGRERFRPFHKIISVIIQVDRKERKETA